MHNIRNVPYPRAVAHPRPALRPMRRNVAVRKRVPLAHVTLSPRGELKSRFPTEINNYQLCQLQTAVRGKLEIRG